MSYKDPPSVENQFRAAETLGKMDADGVLPQGEASKTMGTIVKVAFANAPHVDESGLRARLVWAASDAKKARETQRANAEIAVRWATMALIKRNAPRDEILDAARRAASGVLTDAEMIPILAEEWDRIHKRRGRK